MTAYADNIARPPRTLTWDEQKRLLRTTGERVAGYRDHVLYSLAFGTGLREHELVALDVGDVFDEAGRAKRRVTLHVFKRASKTPAPQEVLLPDVVRAKLEKLLASRKRAGEVITPATPIFMSRLGRRLSTRQVRNAFVVWQKRAGFERRVTFHATRHTACSNLYRQTRDLRLTQRFGRHKSVLTTMLYTHPSDEDLVRGVQHLIC